MHKYADLNRKQNSRLTRLEGNLMVSNRKQSGKRERTRRDSQFILWVVILIMFTVSGLYIRYQALYVEDSVFRDTYLLINEHFLTKEPLPSPNLKPTQNNTVVSQNTGVGNNGLSSAASGSVMSQSPQSPLTQNNISTQSQLLQSTPQKGIDPQQAIPSHSQVVHNNLPPDQTLQTRAITPNNLVGSSQQVQYGTTPQDNQLSVNTTPINNTVGNAVTPLPQALSPVSSPIAPQPLSRKSGVFSYYQPILNSTSTKVGFFVVNKKTEYREQALYQALFNNLLVFKSSNSKVRNFFDPQTRLNSAWIENDTLLLDFNSAFENSKYGYKGIEVKIQQILWTFFNFNEESINKISYISFLIDGKRKDTIGGDGKVLKPFYSRKDLSFVITF